MTAFDDWAESGLQPLVRFATVLCGDRSLGEDVVQDVLLKAYPRWEKIERTEYPEAYLRRMVVNEFLSWRRKWARIVPRADIAVEIDGGVDHAGRHADADELLAEVAKLKRQQRVVLVLRYYCGLSNVEIAETLGCAPVTVRSHASRALSALRVELDPGGRQRPNSTVSEFGANHAN